MTDPEALAVGDRFVGPGHPVFVIAEVSANHGGRLDRALELVERAAEAGADAVKLQTYTPGTMTLDADGPPFVVGEGSLWAGRRLHDLYADAQTPWEWHEPLFEAIHAAGMVPFSTPFDTAAVDLLVELDSPVLKIASFELVDLELVARAASTGRPLIMSTGMATADEIDDAVQAARGAGDGGLVLLRCNSAYPAAPAEMDLRTIPAMIDRWGVPVGLSDHTLSDVAAVVSVAVGACVIEKHVTLRDEPGPDSAFSLEPHELARLVDAVRTAEAALGTVRYGPSTSERSSLAFRRSLFAIADIAAGEVLTRDNIAAIRPGDGLAPKHLPEVLGRRVATDVARATPLRWELLADG